MDWKNVLLCAAAGAGMLLGGCATAPKNETRSATVSAQPIQERTIHVQATELDARRTLDQNPFPRETVDAFPQYFGEGEDPFDRGGASGYYLFMTAEDQWRIGSYLFVPQEVIAYQGERITLEVLGVRGSEHHNVLVGPDGERVKDVNGNDIAFNVRRGELHVVEFDAAEHGLYRLVCCTHQPTMTLNIHVLPR